MDYSTAAKYGAAFVLLASVYALVYLTLIEPAQYYNLVLMALGALGVNSLNGGGK